VLVGSCALTACVLPLPRLIGQIIVIGASALVGAGQAIFTILWGTLQQQNVPNDKSGRLQQYRTVGYRFHPPWPFCSP
jgi:hypothetical protein